MHTVHSMLRRSYPQCMWEGEWTIEYVQVTEWSVLCRIWCVGWNATISILEIDVNGREGDRLIENIYCFGFTWFKSTNYDHQWIYTQLEKEEAFKLQIVVKIIHLGHITHMLYSRNSRKVREEDMKMNKNRKDVNHCIQIMVPFVNKSFRLLPIYGNIWFKRMICFSDIA